MHGLTLLALIAQCYSVAVSVYYVNEKYACQRFQEWGGSARVGARASTLHAGCRD